jgi:kinesin family protein C2/C3
MMVQVERSQSEREEALMLYSKERALRKSIHNKLLELQGNIRVVCRVRPVIELEHRFGQDVDVTEYPSEGEIAIKREKNKLPNRFEYDRVFTPGSTQSQVFEAVQPLCVSVLDGYNICIFAYGQTGSGKTYTMEGDHSDFEHSGVSPRAVGELFRLVASLQPDWTYTLTFSMLEIYNEAVFDLLLDNSSGNGGGNGSGSGGGGSGNRASDKEKLEIRQSQSGTEGSVVAGLTEVEVTSAKQVLELMARGQANRAVGSHDLNEHSSRSHSILTIVCRGRNSIDGTTTFGERTEGVSAAFLFCIICFDTR